MRIRLLTLLSLCGLLFSCSPQVTTVRSLPPQTEVQLQQNLINGRIPTPEEVLNDDIETAPDACTSFKSSLPRDWFQQTLEVPENPEVPDGQKIHIFAYGKVNPHSVPSIFFNGGPGADSHSSFRVLRGNQSVRDSSKKISFIFIDQRGNGCSDFYPQSNALTANTISNETLQRLSHYGSREIVSDAESLRRQLFQNKKWNVFGQSYGAFIVHRYVLEKPDSVHAALAHANVIQSDPFERMKQRIASQVRISDLYFKQYNHDKAKLQALKDFLTLDKCYQSENQTQKVCGHEILQVFASSLLGFNDQWEPMHQWILHIVTGRQNTISEEDLQRFIAVFIFSKNNPLNVKKWASTVIGWVDRNVVVANPYNCQKIRTDLMQEENIDLNRSLMHECLVGLQSNSSQTSDTHYDRVSFLPRSLMSLDLFRDALLSHPNLAFYLYSGEKDSYVPVTNFREELSKLEGVSNLHYTDFSGSGHDGFFSENQVWNDLRDNSSSEDNY